MLRFGGGYSAGPRKAVKKSFPKHARSAVMLPLSIKNIVDDAVEQNFPIQCKGRNAEMKEALREPVTFNLRIYKTFGSSDISSDASKCPYNTGPHGQRCKASHPNQDKVGEGVICPYSFDIPYALEQNKSSK